MLQKIHQHTRGWLAGIIITLVAITFVFWGISNYQHGQVDTTLVEVNGESITLPEFKSAYEQMRQQVFARMGKDFQFTEKFDKQFKKQVLDNVIGEKVLAQAASSMGFYVPMSQAEQVLTQIPAFQENGAFSRQRFLQVLMNLSLSERQFLEKLRTDLLIDQVRSGIINSAFVLPNEVNDVIKLTQQTRNIRYLLITRDRFAKEITISDNDIKKYYQAHQEEFKTPEKISVEYLELSLPQLQQNIQLNEQQLSDFYKAHQSNFKTPGEWQVAHILVKVPSDATVKQVQAAKEKSAKITSELSKGADFSTLAKKYSEDVLTANKGGELPWIKTGTLDPQFENAMMVLKKGEISKPVKTKYGFDIIKLLDQKPSQQISFKDAKQRIEGLLKQQQAQQQFAEASEQLANLTYSNPDSLKIASTTLKLPIQETGLFTREVGKEGILANQKVVNTAFSDDVLLQGNNSEVIQLDNLTLLVIRVKKHEPSALMAIDKVQDKIRGILQGQQEQVKASELGEKLQKVLQSGKNADLPEKQYNLTWTTANALNRNQNNFDPAIVSAAFALPQLSNIPSVKLVPAEKGYAIVSLERVVPADLKTVTDEQRKGYQQQLQRAMGESSYDLYAKSLMQRAKIKYKSADF